ncbi:MAG TPA: hypothetical protein VEB86_01345 [Chryseosolibacter sp.]|nr:hypothetical protein [Chryseosolibacter sp.]
MKIKLLILFVSIIFVTCEKTKTRKEKVQLKIRVEIVPEGDSLYTLAWEDTIGQSNNSSTADRLKELWCVLTVDDDTVGHYWGTSTPRDYTYFQTSDSVIQAEFMIGPNVFSSKMTKGLLDDHQEIIRFAPVDINIKTNLRKRMELILMEK